MPSTVALSLSKMRATISLSLLSVTYKPRPACGNLLSQVGSFNYKLHSLLEKISLKAFNKRSWKPNSFSKG